jgi:hypothetical protein
MDTAVELKAKIAELQRQLAATPEISAALAEANARPETKARRSAASKAMWSDPEWKVRNLAAIRAGLERAKAAGVKLGRKPKAAGGGS